MAFDQVEFVTLLTDYYEFCNRVFWEDSIVAESPSNDGWPCITQSTMANLHKNDAAIQLLCHMPFVDIEPDKFYAKHVIMLNTRIQDYRSDEMQDRIRNGDLEGYVEPVLSKGEFLPPSCICFGNSKGRNGYFLVVDTADGYVYWGDPCGPHDEPEPELNAVVRERYAGNEAERWRETFNVYRPCEFFALCKQRFRELRWIGIQTDIVEAMPMDCDFDEADDEFKSLVRKMKRAGWPGDGEGRGWDRAAFQASLNEDSDEENEDAAHEKPTHYIRT
ncbi:hypothetical protein FB567DRAFT_531371 [Paraphoma chrysanthemicola]|uniref:Uncharacterized protein n=1 Tax=Paraphoma chrysanthemicola TaxID=798071 RepID=A0A8K0R366_9PLEO|nr:hypothetical protein FB567DRAFT_531371 [Paraphoma chrysanthemicola]